MLHNFFQSIYFSIIAIIIAGYVMNYFSDILGHNLQIIAIKAKIPPNVRGVLLDGISSSIPEFLSAVIAAMMVLGVIGEPDPTAFEDIGVGTIGGSAIFNILMIPFLSILFISEEKIKEIEIDKKAMLRDMFVYMIAVILLFAASIYGKITPFIGGVMTFVYVAYGYYLVKHSKGQVADHLVENYKDKKMFNLILIALLSLIPIGYAVHVAIEKSIILGKHFNIPIIVMALVVNAIVTSMPDALLSMRSARNGELDASISNAVGSNSFDILICLGMVVMVSGTTVVVNFKSVSYIFVFLLISSAIYTYSFYQKLSKKTILFLLGMIYALFIAYLIYII